MNYNDQIIERVVEAYCKATNNTEFTKDEVIAWAIENGAWKPSKKSIVELLRQELSVAMRSDRKKVNGRKVRQWHNIRRKLKEGYVQTVWAHIDVATEPFMETSIAQQRKGVAGIVYSIHNTIVYWKKKNPSSKIQALFDFRDDIKDRDHAIDSGQIIDDEDDDNDDEGGIGGVDVAA